MGLQAALLLLSTSLLLVTDRCHGLSPTGQPTGQPSVRPTVDSGGFPVDVHFGFSARVLEIVNGVYSRNFVGAQQVAAAVMAMATAKAYFGNEVTLKMHSYLGQQFLNPTQKRNDFFDGAFGGCMIGNIGHPIVGLVAADLEVERVRSMCSTFGGWNSATFIASQQDTEFSHGNNYPLKARIVPSDSFQAAVLVPVLQSLGWKRVAVFHSSDTVGADLYTNLARTAAADGGAFDIIHTENLLVTALDFSEAIARAKDTGATIFLLLLANKMQALLLQQGFSQGLFGPHTQTIGVSISSDTQEIAALLPAGSPAADIMRGHAVLHFQPRVLFQTPAGQQFVRLFKQQSPTRGEPGQRLFSDFVNRDGKESWFNNCKVWSNTAAGGFPFPYPQQEFSGAIDGGSPFFTIDPLQGRFPVTPAGTGYLYGIPLVSPSSGDAFFPPATNPPATTYDPIEYGIYGPSGGLCLGISAAELASIPADGSEVIDPSVLYVYDAVLLIAAQTEYYLRSRASKIGNLTSLQLTSRIRDYYNTVIPSNRASGLTASVPRMGLTGNMSFHVGYPAEDDFMLGDRVSGFPYALQSFDPVSMGYRIAGYWDPQLLAFVPCSAGASTLTVLGVAVACAPPVYRSADGTRPSDMQPAMHLTLPAAYKTTLIFFGALGVALCLGFFALLALYWNSSALKMKQQNVLLWMLLGALLAQIKVLISGSWAVTEASCAADYWLAHLSFRLTVLALMFKLWRVDKIFNATGLKRIRITETAILIRILVVLLSAVVVLGLIAGLGGPRVREHVELFRNQLIITRFCGLPSNLPATVLRGILEIFQGLGLLAALYYSWRTKNVPAVVNEAHLIIPSLIAATALVVTLYALLASLNPAPTDYAFAVNLVFALGGSAGTTYYFGSLFLGLRAAASAASASKASPDDTHPRTSGISGQAPTEGGRAMDRSFGATSAGTGVMLRRRSSLPQGVALDTVYMDVATELLRVAKGGENKVRVCQEKIQYWQSVMFKVAENEDFGGSGTTSGGTLTHASSVYVAPDDDDGEQGDDNDTTIACKEGPITTTASSSNVKQP